MDLLTPSIGAQTISKESEILNLIDEAIFELNEDGIFVFLNTKGEKLWKKSEAEILGKQIWQEFPEYHISPLYKAVERTLKEKTSGSEEFFFPITVRRVSVKTIPSLAGVLIILTDIQDEWENKRKLIDGELRLKDAQEIGHIGSFEWDLPENKIKWSDELYLIHGLKPQSVEVTFENLFSFVHEEDHQDLLESIHHIQHTGKPLNAINRIVRADGEIRYVHRRAQIIQDEPVRIYGTVQDITDQKRREVALKESKILLQSAFDASPNSISVFNIIYTNEGVVEDFEFLIVNEFTLKTAGLIKKDLIGKKLSQMFPHLLKIGVFDQFKTVALTGEIADFEKWYEGDSLCHWFRFIITKLDNLLIVTTEDITGRKNAEKEIKESRDFIEKISSTVPDLISIHDTRTELLVYINHEKFWMEYNKPSSEMNKMKDYERANEMLHPDSLEKGKLFLKERIILEGEEMKEVELKMLTGNWIKIRSKVFKRDEKGMPTQILSITTNITERKNALEKLVKLKLSQQKEILNAVLIAQEEDRKKIAESLHNDLGQLLYAVKLRSESLQPDPSLEEQIHLKSEIDKLLEEAIAQSRNISLQLTSQLLEIFGLNEAIEAMAARFRSDSLFINYKFIGETNRFNPEVEISCFRIVQELINNIVKHSQASVANIRVESEEKFIKIIAKDNGQGFKTEVKEEKQWGLGMWMISNRVKLMDGTMTIDSSEDSGTLISIVLNIE